MAELDYFIKKTFAAETAAITHGAVTWWLPPELGMVEVRLDGLLIVLQPGVLASLPPPRCLFGTADEIVIELKMQGDHLTLIAVDRALLRRQAWQVKRREDKTATAPWDGEEPLCLVAPHVPAWLFEHYTVELVAPGCYRVGTAPFQFVWVAANDLPLADELVPFLVARSGTRLDEFVDWVKTRRPLDWLDGVLDFLPMSNATYEDLRQFIYAKTDDPMIRARRRDTLRYGLEAEPEVRDELIERGRREQARSVLRRVLAMRSLTLSAKDEAQIDACTELDTLGRWLGQAFVAGDVAEALR